MAGDVSAGPESVLVTEPQAGAVELISGLTADTTRSVDLMAALTLHEVCVFW